MQSKQQSKKCFFTNYNLCKIIVIFISPYIFSVSSITLDQNQIPKIQFTSIMQSEFRKQLQRYQLEQFDDLSEFSHNFIGVVVTQASIDQAVSKAFEKFGLACRQCADRNHKKFELKDLEKITSKEQKIKELLVQVVRTYVCEF